MNVQVIMRDGQPEYAVLPWTEYQALLKAAASRSGVAEAGQSIEPPSAVEKLAQLSVLRQARGMSQEDLARTVGISPHYLALIESGERTAEGPITRALARALGLSAWEDEN